MENVDRPEKNKKLLKRYNFSPKYVIRNLFNQILQWKQQFAQQSLQQPNNQKLLIALQLAHYLQIYDKLLVTLKTEIFLRTTIDI